jgi:HPt (histidine-containing phosphotransfer) domain-containing protein
MGARAVQQAAAELEQACREGAAPDRLDALLALVLEALAPVMAALAESGWPAQETQTMAEPIAHGLDRAQQLVWLQDLLQCADPCASDLVLQLQRVSRGTPMADMLRQLEAAVERFDYDAALALLQDFNHSSQSEVDPEQP